MAGFFSDSPCIFFKGKKCVTVSLKTSQLQLALGSLFLCNEEV